MGNRVWKWDTYDLRRHAAWSIATFVDIGANLGGVSMMSRVLFPIARTHAIEPSKGTYDLLVAHAGVWGIKCYNVALGDGEDLYLHGRKAKGYDKYLSAIEKLPRSEKENHSSDLDNVVKSYSLPQLFGLLGVDISKPYILKIDCEGGERFILRDDTSIGYLKNATKVLLELHFGLGGTPEEWTEYFSQLKDTHDLLLMTWQRDSYRRYYVYEPIDEVPTNFKGCMVQLLDKAWKEKEDAVWWM